MLSALPTRRQTIFAVSLCAIAYLYVVPYHPRINNPNENVRFYMTAALAERGEYVIDEERRRWGWVNDCAVREGHAYSVKAPGTSFLGVPAYWVYLQFSEVLGRPFDRATALWLCRVFGSIIPWLMFLPWLHRWLGRHTGSPLVRDAVFVSLALGSCLYGYGLLFMSHTLSAAAAFGGFMLLFDARHAGRIRPGRAFAAGLLVASATLLEYPGFVASALLALYGLLAVRPYRRFLPFALGGLVPTVAMMHFQWRCFGSPFSPGHLYVENDFFRGRHEEGFFGAVGLQWDALYGLLIDPGAGLFPLTPLLAFAFLGFGGLLWARRHRVEGMVALLIFGGTLAGIAVMNNWRGGWTIGPRYLALVYPFVGWAALVGLERVWRWRPGVAGPCALGLTVVGLVMSGLPGAYYPHFPSEVDRPVSQIVAVLVGHGYAPHNAAELIDIHGTESMLPLAAVAVVVLVWLAGGVPRGALRRQSVMLGGVLAGAVLFALCIDPRPAHPEVRRALALITRTWQPHGHDEAARLSEALRTTPSEPGYRRLAGLYEREGRDREARDARARAEREAAGEGGRR